MTITVDYNQIWEWIAVDGVTKQTFYGADFNPTPFTFPSWWSSVIATNPTTLFDLTWFQPWHEVGCWVIVLWSNVNYNTTLYADFQRYQWGRETSWYYSWTMNVAAWGQRVWYMYFWVDDDEIWEWYSGYRIHYYTQDNQVNVYSPEFDESWLSFDDTRHRSGYLRVEGSRLCYTDWVRNGTQWYKHKIAYDSSYDTYVWTDYAWAIRLDSGDNLCIYYVDEYGIRRRTYSSDAWYWWNVNVWSSNSWYMRVCGSPDGEDGYGHLCFIAPNGSKRRILNWPVSWST
jgi:hypothetical protein